MSSVEAHKVELLCNAEVIHGLLIPIYQTVWAVCFESGPRESSVNGFHGYLDTIQFVVHTLLFIGSPRLMVAKSLPPSLSP